MRHPEIQQDTLFITDSRETRPPKHHPVRPIQPMVDATFKAFARECGALDSAIGRDSAAPGVLLRARLPMALNTTRSERQLMKQIDYNPMSCWLVGRQNTDFQFVLAFTAHSPVRMRIPGLVSC